MSKRWPSQPSATTLLITDNDLHYILGFEYNNPYIYNENLIPSIVPICHLALFTNLHNTLKSMVLLAIPISPLNVLVA